MKLRRKEKRERDGGAEACNLILPSRRSSAFERLILRARVETVDVVVVERRDFFFKETTVVGASVREMRREGILGIEGRRGGAEATGTGVGALGTGSSGRVIEGAGLGEGMLRIESRE